MLNNKINIIEEKLNIEINKNNIVKEKLNIKINKNNIVGENLENEIIKVKETIIFLTNEIEKQIKIIPISNNPCHFVDFNCHTIEFTVIDKKLLCLFDYCNYDYDRLFNVEKKFSLDNFRFDDINYKLIDITNLTNNNLQSFFSQFKNIKNIYFNFGNNCNNNFGYDKYSHKIFKICSCLFSKTIDINVIFKTFDININEKIEIINTFTEMNNYKSINVKIINNLIDNDLNKFYKKSNSSYVSHECFDNLKNHCQLNNINFSSNIGL